jgi:hypothetical protein
MGKKFVIGSLTIIVLLTIAFYVFNSYIYNEKQADYPVGTVETKTGKIIAIDLEQIAADGPYVINIETANKEVSSIAVPSMGLPMCKAYPSIVDIGVLKIGDEVSVSGIINEAGEIVPCESAEHYLRLNTTINP